MQKKSIHLNGKKRCATCMTFQAFSEFVKNRAMWDGLSNRCKSCKRKEHQIRWAAKKEELMAKARQRIMADPQRHAAMRRAQKLKRDFGLSIDDLDRMRSVQGNACAICGSTPKKLCVDHCHKTNRVRGLLCTHCNLAIGQFGDNPETLAAAAAYLKSAATNTGEALTMDQSAS